MNAKNAPTLPTGAPAGDRIAKVLARRGVASRRSAETMIAEGRISVNGKVIASPALNVTDRDRIEVDGKPLPEAVPSKLWLYHKPVGLVTTEKDELGRPTVFGALPPNLGRVMSVGRLDITSEGLLLLTNDGDLKRRLELPSTGWLRKYRVRVNGRPEDASLEPLRKGVVIEGERFQPMTVTIDRQQGANAWLTVGIREGRNREVRRAMEAVGLTVNRLIRVSYGPFRLAELAAGAVEEVRPKVLRDQLGIGGAQDADESATKVGTAKAGAAKARMETARAGKSGTGKASRALSGSGQSGPGESGGPGRGKPSGAGGKPAGSAPIGDSEGSGRHRSIGGGRRTSGSQGRGATGGAKGGTTGRTTGRKPRG